MPGREYYGAGYGEMANLPKEAKMQNYPMCDAYLNVELDDSGSGIDAVNEANSRNMKANLSKEKY